MRFYLYNVLYSRQGLPQSRIFSARDSMAATAAEVEPAGEDSLGVVGLCMCRGRSHRAAGPHHRGGGLHRSGTFDKLESDKV